MTTNGCFLKTKPQKFDAAMVYYKLKKNSKTLKRILRIKTLGKNLGKKTNILGQWTVSQKFCLTTPVY